MTNDRPMTPGQAADFLGVGTTALKKYALLLEQHGYKVSRNAKNHREYNGMDIALIRAMLILNRIKSVPLDEAASAVTSDGADIDLILSYDKTDDTRSDTHTTELTVTPTHVPEGATRVAELVTQLQTELQARDALHVQFMSDVSDKLAEQTELIDELRKEIAELRAEKEEEQKRSIWSRLFSRGDSDASKKG